VKGGEGALYIHGYGGSLEDPGLRAFLEGLSGSGFSVTCALLPITFSDITSEILRPIEDHIRENGIRHVIGFSLGGLVATYLDVDGKRVFISPLWGLGPLMKVVGMKGALAVASGSARAVLGGSAGDRTIVLERFNDQTITEMEQERSAEALNEAMRSIPPPNPSDVVIFSRSDNIISLEAIEARGVRTYDLMGGHMVFSGRDRNKLVKKVLFYLKDPK
jgi:esterase/lipase